MGLPAVGSVELETTRESMADRLGFVRLVRLVGVTSRNRVLWLPPDLVGGDHLVDSVGQSPQTDSGRVLSPVPARRNRRDFDGQCAVSYIRGSPDPLRCQALMKYAIYEHPRTHAFGLLPLPNRFVDGDALPIRDVHRWFKTHDEAIAALTDLLNREDWDRSHEADGADGS